MKKRKLVGVIGTGIKEELANRLTEEVGQELVRRRVSVVCSGLGGVMAAVSRGIRMGRGRYRGESLVVGLLPGDSTDFANRFLDLAIYSGLGIGRNLLIVRVAQAVIAISGGSGTLSGLALSWQLGRPIVAPVPARWGIGTTCRCGLG
jgi:hypothetical protein